MRRICRIIACQLLAAAIAAAGALAQQPVVNPAHEGHIARTIGGFHLARPIAGSGWRAVPAKKHHAKKHTKTRRRRPKTGAKPSKRGSDPVLLGDQSIESTVASNPAGSAETFSFVGQISGTPTSMNVYVDARNRATALIAGLYSDLSGHPGSLLTTGSIGSIQAGAWNTVLLSRPVTVNAGTTYWVAVLSRKGTLYFRTGSGNACVSQDSGPSHLNALPSPWKRGSQGTDCPISAYVDGTSVGPSLSSPVDTVAPAITGTPIVGQTLTTSPGSWMNASTYSYQWQDCDATGSNCASISGAVGTIYTLTANDANHTIRSVVTASNAGGSTTASSAATAAVSMPASPTASFSYSPTNPTTGQTVHFDASGSTCAATPCSYTWATDPPSGGATPLGSGQSLDFSFQTAGTEYVTLLVVDALNSSASVEHDVVVTAPPTSVPGPANTAPPAISGTPSLGQTLTTSNGSWNNSPTSFTYQWQDCNSSGASCVNIRGATSSSYILQSSDVTHTIRSIVTAANSAGSASATSGPTAVVTQPVPPTMTVAPAVTGTAQQSSVLSVSTGTWAGDNPMTFTYQWQQDGTKNISGATSSTYTAQASDMGHTLDAVVTVTNDAGKASATSNSTAVVTASSGLPSSVTLQQIDGGMNYFSKFSNVPAAWSTPAFFPIAGWNEPFPATGDSTDIAAYKNVGVNGFINLANGYTSTLLSQLSQSGMWFINYEGGLKSSVPQAAPMVGHFWADEADGSNHCGDIPSAAALGETVTCSPTSDGRTPSSAIAQATSDYHGAHGAGDPTRFVYGQYTKPVSLNEGLSSSQAAGYENAVDVISYDHYIINDGWESTHNLWQQYDEVQNVRSQDNYSKPVWPFIEAPSPFDASQWSGVRATPAMIVAEAWNAIIGGARGIEYFDTDFCGSTCGYPGGGMTLASSNSGYAALQTAVKAFNNELTALAPIINGPFANGYVQSSVTNGSQMNVMAKYDQGSNKFYVFAAPRFNSIQTATYTVAGGYTGPVTVYGENRTVQATNGVFTDQIASQTDIHIYAIPN